MRRQEIDPSLAWTKIFNISAGQRVGNSAYLPNLVGSDEVYLQSLQIFRNIKQALASGGGILGDLVRITIHLVDIENYPEFFRARTVTLPAGSPASTALATPALVTAELQIEIEATATLSDRVQRGIS